MTSRSRRTTVEIDPNVRVRGNGTFSALRHVSGPIAVGRAVTVVEPEGELVGDGRVTEIDLARGLVFLAVDWSSLHEASPGEATAGANRASGSTGSV